MPNPHPYRALVAMTALSFVSMYVLMYAMVDVLDNVVHHWNQVYMAALMAAPMVAIELSLMRGMYPDKRRNRAFLAGSAVLAVVAFAMIRFQTGIGDRQFLRSMIPHHAGAILMCEKASLRDPEIERLCHEIIASQRAEIAQMKAILERLER